MTLAALIDLLVADLTPVRPGMLTRLIAVGVGSGSVVSLTAVLILWGPRPDWNDALVHVSFWAKAAFTLALGISGFLALLKLARPGQNVPRATIVIALIFLVMGTAAGLQLALAEPAARMSLIFGATSAVCSWLIMALSVPILCGTLRALRAMAPTRLRLTGAMAGMTAGAFSAAVYAIACDEKGMPFVFLWYGLAIACVSLFGALIGPKTLRW